MRAMASQITSLAIVYSTVHPGLLKLCITGLCAATGVFPAQRASNAEMFPFADVITNIWRLSTAIIILL